MQPQNNYSDEKDDTKNKNNIEKENTKPTGKDDTKK